MAPTVRLMRRLGSSSPGRILHGGIVDEVFVLLPSPSVDGVLSHPRVPRGLLSRRPMALARWAQALKVGHAMVCCRPRSNLATSCVPSFSVDLVQDPMVIEAGQPMVVR
jgi:hypothetical protein